MRSRATRSEMDERHAGLIELAEEHGPASVRHLFYRAVVAGLPGITKDVSGYLKVQRAVLRLRRAGEIPYDRIVDTTRWMRKPNSWDGVHDVLYETSRIYRRNLWANSLYRVEVWCESESIAGVLFEVTSRWDVPLMPCRGFSSETFTYSAAEAWAEDDRTPIVFYVGDHDPAGLQIERNLRNRLIEFSGPDFEFYRIGVTWEQVEEFDLPGTKPKKQYGFPLAVEAEALPPDILRNMIDKEIQSYVDHGALTAILAAEESERVVLTRIAETAKGAA